MRIFIDKMKYALIKEGYIFIKKIGIRRKEKQSST